MKKYLLQIFLLISIGFTLVSCINLYEPKKKLKSNSVLLLELKGLITSETSEKFMENVREYVGKEEIKGVLVRVNSPGGTVAASQEINATVNEIKNYYKKPVIVSGGDIVASGGVYSIMPADKILLSPGTLFGSVGVLMQFQNLGELARWAKVEVYALKAGEFKDSGNPFREMTLRERELFENTLDTVLDQFKEAIQKGRNLDQKMVDRIADGRIMTGEEALQLGLVDQIGSFNEAIKVAGKLSGLGSDPNIFSPVTEHPLSKYFGDGASSVKNSILEKVISKFSALSDISGQPLYILPSYLFPQ
ncbi:MAG: signal peptide peptidase SppA [Bdellovibrionales bacterium]